MTLFWIALLVLCVDRAKCFTLSTKLRSHVATSSQLASSDTDTENEIFTIKVALTREEGKNDKLQEALSNHPTASMLKNSLRLDTKELPCIETRTGPDLEAFNEMVNDLLHLLYMRIDN